MQKTRVWSLVRDDPLRRKWQPTSVFLPGEFHGHRSLAGYSPWDHKESDNDWAANTFTFFTFENFWAVNPIRRVENWDIGIKIYVCVCYCICVHVHTFVCLFSIKLLKLIISQVRTSDTNIIVSILWNFLKLWNCWTREGLISCCVWRQEHGYFIFIFPLVSFLSLLLVFLEPLRTDFETL